MSSDSNRYIEKDFLFKIENGIWKGFFVEYPSTLIYAKDTKNFEPVNAVCEEEIKHHPKILNANKKIIAETNYGGGSIAGNIYYNHDSRRKEEYIFNFETMTARYKSKGHWAEYSLYECISNKPYIIPTNLKDGTEKRKHTIKKKIEKMYSDSIPSSFNGILDYKRWGENEELFIFITDNSTLKKYMMKVTIDTEYQSERGKIDFLSIPLRTTIKISTSSKEKIVPTVLNAEIIADKPVFPNIDKSLLKGKKEHFILNTVCALYVPLECPACKDETEIFVLYGGGGIYTVNTNGETTYSSKENEIISIDFASEAVKEGIKDIHKYGKQYNFDYAKRSTIKQELISSCPYCNHRITDKEAMNIINKDDFGDSGSPDILPTFGLLSGEMLQ